MISKRSISTESIANGRNLTHTLHTVYCGTAVLTYCPRGFHGAIEVFIV